MKTAITLLIEHEKPIPKLGDLIAQRAWTLPGVKTAELQGEANSVDLIELPVVEMTEEVKS